MNVGTVVADGTINTSAFRSGIGSMRQMGARVARDISQRFDRVGRRLTSIGRQMTARITAPILGVGAGMLKMASDAEETQSKFNAVFQGLSNDVRQWAVDTANATNRSRFALEGYLARLQDTFVPMGIARDEAAGLSQTVTQLALDVASFNNEAESDVVDAFTSALVGNVQAVRRYGINLTQAALDQELLNMGFADGARNASQQQLMLARLNVMLKSTEDAQGDAERTAGSFANQMRGLRAQFKELGVVMGNEILPRATEMVGKFSQLVRGFANADSATRQSIISYGALAAAIPVVTLALGGLARAIAFVLTPLSLKIAAIAGLVGTFEYVRRNLSAFSDHFQRQFVIMKNTLVLQIAGMVDAFDRFISWLPGIEAPLEGVKDAILGIISPLPEVENEFQTFRQFLGDVTSDVHGWLSSLVDPLFQLGATASQTGQQVAGELMEAFNRVSNFLRNDFSGSFEDATTSGMDKFNEMSNFIATDFTTSFNDAEREGGRFMQTITQGLSQALFYSQSFSDSLDNILRQLGSQLFIQGVTGLLGGGGASAVFGGLFHSGGKIPGVGERQITAKGGEYVLTPQQMNAMGNRGSSEVTVNVTISGESQVTGDMIRTVYDREVKRINRMT